MKWIIFSFLLNGVLWKLKALNFSELHFFSIFLSSVLSLVCQRNHWPKVMTVTVYSYAYLLFSKFCNCRYDAWCWCLHMMWGCHSILSSYVWVSLQGSQHYLLKSPEWSVLKLLLKSELHLNMNGNFWLSFFVCLWGCIALVTVIILQIYRLFFWSTVMQVCFAVIRCIAP